MESLFARQAPKRGRLCLMLGASLLVHGGIVGIAALWLQPDPEPRTVVEWFPSPEGGGPSPWYPPATPEASQPEITTPTPPEVEPPVPTPPISDQDPEMEPAGKPTPAPRRPMISRPDSATHVTGPQGAAHPSSNQPGGGIPNALNAGQSTAVGTWVTPHPSYPHLTLAIRPTGTTTVRITTDASGRVSNVIIVKSAGNAILDNQTESFVRMNWHGPPNASRTTEFVYQIR